MLLPREEQTSDRAGNADGQMAVVVPIFGSYTPSFMNIVGDAPAGAVSRKSYATGCPVGRPKHEEPAAADVAGRRVRDREREGRRDGRIHRVAAATQDVGADFRRVGVGGHDHALRGPDRLRADGSVPRRRAIDR